MSQGWKKVAAVGVFGSRMDHTLSAMSITLKHSSLNPHLELFLVSTSTLAYLIKPKIYYNIEIGEWISQKGCGLIPFSRVSAIETSGFKWNLGENEEFSSL